MLMKISILLAFLLTLTWGQSLAADLKQGDMAPGFLTSGFGREDLWPEAVQGKAGGGAGLVPQGFHGGLNG